MTDPTAVTTVSHVRQADAALVEVDLDQRQAERAERGESFGTYDEPRVFSNALGIGRLNARIDQIREEMDELVDRHPELKSWPRSRDDEPPAP